MYQTEGHLRSFHQSCVYPPRLQFSMKEQAFSTFRFSEDGVSEDGAHGNGTAGTRLGVHEVEIGCSRKVKFFRFPKLCPHRQPFGITLENLPLRRPGWPEWGGALGSSLAFPLLSGNLWKTKCFLTFPLLGRKKDGRCLEKRQRDNSCLAEPLSSEQGLPMQEGVPGAHWFG